MPSPKQGTFLGDRVPSRADIIILVITTIRHLVGNPCGSSTHFKMVLLIPSFWVKMNSSLALALSGSFIIIAFVAAITLVVAVLVVEMIGRPLIVVLAASLISIVEIVVVVAVVVVAMASAVTTTLVSSATTASSTATTVASSLSQSRAMIGTVAIVIAILPLVMEGVLAATTATDV